MNPQPGRIVTFYSYKGGTGRSMMLANFAWILAAGGKRVLTLDWDLEAPGLHRYFRPFLIDPDLAETDGLIDVCWTYAASAMNTLESPQPGAAEAGSFGESLEQIAVRLDHEFPSGGYIDFVGAGRQTPTYSQSVNTFEWSRFYDIGGSQLLREARTHLTAQYDWVLIDSRTGVSDTAGISTMQLPDMVVACFTLNRQSVEGVAAVLRSVREFRGDGRDGAQIVFFPIATRIENAEQARLENGRTYARKLLAEFLPSHLSPRAYWDAMEVAYRPAYAFEEMLAAYGDATGASGASDTMLAQVERIAQQITGDTRLRIPEILDADRVAVLALYALPNAQASFDLAPPAPTAMVPAIDDSGDFLRGVLAKEQIWRTSDFRYQLLLSRRELDLLTDEDRRKFGRTMAYYVLQSERAESVFHTANWYFLAAVLSGLLIGSAAYALGWIPLVLGSGLQKPLAIAVAAVLGCYCWAGVSFLLGALLRSAKNAPYGLRLANALQLTLYGPFRPAIKDYGPDMATAPAQSDARRPP